MINIKYNAISKINDQLEVGLRYDKSDIYIDFIVTTEKDVVVSNFIKTNYTQFIKDNFKYNEFDKVSSNTKDMMIFNKILTQTLINVK